MQPDALAHYVDGGGFLTYLDWEQRSNAVARGLLARGIRPGERVALIYDNRWWLDYAVAYVAVHKVAAVAVPLAPRLSLFDLTRILANSEAVVAVCPSDLAPTGKIAWAGAAELEDGQSGRSLSVTSGPRHDADILYSVGAMTPPHGRVRSQGQVLERGIGSAGPLAFLHGFSVGTEAGQQALVRPLLDGHGASMTMSGLDLERFDDLVARQGIRKAGVTSAVARVVGAPRSHDGDALSS